MRLRNCVASALVLQCIEVSAVLLFVCFHVFDFARKFAKLPISSLCVQLALVCT